MRRRGGGVSAARRGSVPGDARRDHARVRHHRLERAHLRRQLRGDRGVDRVGGHGRGGGDEARDVGGGGGGGVAGGGLDEGVDEAGAGHARHLLHAPDLPLLLRVGQLHHQAAARPRHRARPVQLRDGALRRVRGGKLHEGATLAVAVLVAEDGALLDDAVVLEDVPDLLLGLLLAEHTHEQLPVLAAVGLVVRGLDLQRPVHAGQRDLLVQRGLAAVRALPRAVGQEGAALVHPRQLVLEHGELVNLPELFKHWSQVVVLEVAGDLAHEQLDGVLALLRIIVLFSIELHLRECGGGVEGGVEAEAGRGEAGADEAGHEGRGRLGHEAGGREEAGSLAGLQLRAGRDDLRLLGLRGHHQGPLGEVHRAWGHQHDRGEMEERRCGRRFVSFEEDKPDCCLCCLQTIKGTRRN